MLLVTFITDWLVLVAVGKLRKATLSFIYVRLSVRMEQLDSHWTDFQEILYLVIFRKSVTKIRVLLKSDKNNRYFTCRPTYIVITCGSVLLRLRKVQTKFVVKIKKQILYSVNFFEKSCRLWDNVEKYRRRNRPQLIIQYGACALRAGYIKLLTQTQNM
jgi:hypothetical protein